MSLKLNLTDRTVTGRSDFVKATFRMQRPLHLDSCSPALRAWKDFSLVTTRCQFRASRWIIDGPKGRQNAVLRAWKTCRATDSHVDVKGPAPTSGTRKRPRCPDFPARYDRHWPYRANTRLRDGVSATANSRSVIQVSSRSDRYSRCWSDRWKKSTSRSVIGRLRHSSSRISRAPAASSSNTDSNSDAVFSPSTTASTSSL
jgi:hypothetical protein